MSRGVLLLAALAFASSVAADAWVSFRDKEHRVIEVSNIQLENGVRKSCIPALEQGDLFRRWDYFEPTDRVLVGCGHGH
jgi:hypothetical protein